MSENSGKNEDSDPPLLPSSTLNYDAGQDTFVSVTRSQRIPRKGIFTITAGDEVGKVIPIPTRSVVTLGRSPECAIRFDDGNLSRLHAHLMNVGGEYIFSDARSKNGSFVNDRRVEEAVVLRDGDRVQLGPSVRLRFALVDEAEEKALQDLYQVRKKGGLVTALEQAGQREDLREDLLQAREFQKRILLPPPDVAGLSTEILYQPLDLVGGDFYQVFTLPDGILRVFVADATGHGVKASLTTVLISSEYELAKRENGPSCVLAALNQRISTHFTHLSVHFTALCADLDFRAGVLRFSTAAHPAPCLLREGNVTELETGGSFVGLMPELEFPEWSHEIKLGDHVVFYTDGALEAFNNQGESFGEERLCEAFRCAIAAEKPMGDFLKMVLAQFTGGLSLSDDLTLVDVSWTGPIQR